MVCKLLKAGHHLRNHWHSELGLWGHYCDIVCPGSGCSSVCNGVTFYLSGKFLSCLAALGPTVNILKSACNHFLCGTVSSVFKVGVGGICGSVGGAPWKLTEVLSYGSARSACSVGRLASEIYMANFEWGSAIAGGGLSGRDAWFLRGSSLFRMCHSGVPLVVKLNLTLIWCGIMWMDNGWVKCWTPFFSVDGLRMG